MSGVSSYHAVAGGAVLGVVLAGNFSAAAQILHASPTSLLLTISAMGSFTQIGRLREGKSRSLFRFTGALIAGSMVGLSILRFSSRENSFGGFRGVGGSIALGFGGLVLWKRASASPALPSRSQQNRPVFRESKPMVPSELPRASDLRFLEKTRLWAYSDQYSAEKMLAHLEQNRGSITLDHIRGWNNGQFVEECQRQKILQYVAMRRELLGEASAYNIGDLSKHLDALFGKEPHADLEFLGRCEQIARWESWIVAWPAEVLGELPDNLKRELEAIREGFARRESIVALSRLGQMRVADERGTRIEKVFDILKCVSCEIWEMQSIMRLLQVRDWPSAQGLLAASGLNSEKAVCRYLGASPTAQRLIFYIQLYTDFSELRLTDRQCNGLSELLGLQNASELGSKLVAMGLNSKEAVHCYLGENPTAERLFFYIQLYADFSGLRLTDRQCNNLKELLDLSSVCELHSKLVAMELNSKEAVIRHLGKEPTFEALMGYIDSYDAKENFEPTDSIPLNLEAWEEVFDALGIQGEQGALEKMRDANLRLQQMGLRSEDDVHRVIGGNYEAMKENLLRFIQDNLRR